jgi:phenylacetate-CoA ligase
LNVLEGKPITVGYTKKDIETWSDIVARALVSGGVDEDSIIHT